MNIQKTFADEPLNFPKEIQPLFDAMNAGNKIKKIVCMKGNMNRNNPEKDYEICDFIATDYWVAASQNHNGSEKFDYVDIVDDKGNEMRSFYMNLVRSFELY